VERVVPTRFDLDPRLAPKRMGTMRSTQFGLGNIFCSRSICKIAGARRHSPLSAMPDPIQKPRPAAPAPGGGGGDGPKEPQVEKPNTEDLLKRMRKVDPDQARRYRQRTGE
jgi:hypothetical protein